MVLFFRRCIKKKEPTGDGFEAVKQSDDVMDTEDNKQELTEDLQQKSLKNIS